MTTSKTWGQFVSQYEHRHPRGELPLKNKVRNQRRFQSAFPCWKDRVKPVIESGYPLDTKIQELQVIQREYLLDLRELHPDRREDIAPWLRMGPRNAIKRTESLH